MARRHPPALKTPALLPRRIPVICPEKLLWLACLALLFLSLRPAWADTLILKSGERVTGTVVQQNVLEVVIDSATQGRLTFPRSAVETVESSDVPAREVSAPEPSLESLFTTSLPPTTPAATAALIPLALPPSLPSATNFVARVYWDGRLRYQLSTKIALPDPFSAGSSWVDERLQLRGRVGAKLAVDGATFASKDGQQSVPSDVQLRSLQFLTEGELGVWLTNQYSLEMGLVDGQFYLAKAFWRFVQIPHFGDLTLGYFTVPQTLDNIMAFGSLNFMEPSAGTAAFSPGKRVGIQWHETYLHQRMTATLGLFSVGQDASIDFGNASEALAEPVFRLTGLPWAEQDRWLHLGLSYAFIFSGESNTRYRARPESRMAPFLVDTGEIDSRQSTIGGLEAASTFGPILLQAEITNSRLLEEERRNTFFGGYFAGGWMITGESRPYNRATGIPTRVKPHHPLWGPDAGWGAFEATGRISLLNLNDGPVQGGRMQVLMTGVNWYWNQYLRLQFNFGLADVQGGPSPGKLRIVEARFEGQF